jgi:hypothetical protein
MRSQKIKMVSSHYWLKHPGEKIFHAFLIAKSGAHSGCGGGLPISNLESMDIPGEHSGCCSECFFWLYGVNFSVAADVARIEGGLA